MSKLTEVLHLAHVHLRLVANLQNEHDMEMKLASIEFSNRVGEAFRSSWLQTLGNHRLIDRSYCTILLEHMNESQVNVCVVEVIEHGTARP